MCGLVIVIATISLYLVYPKYYYLNDNDGINCRGNEITGEAELFLDGKWKKIDKKIISTTVVQETIRQSLSPKQQKLTKWHKRKKRFFC